MSDNKDKTDYKDISQVNANEAYELQYWSKKWGVSSEELKETIKKIGSNSVSKLEEYFKK